MTFKEFAETRRLDCATPSDESFVYLNGNYNINICGGDLGFLLVIGTQQWSGQDLQELEARLYGWYLANN